VSYAIEQYRTSGRRACRRPAISRSSRGYQPAADRDETLRQRIRELARERQRFGHLRLTILLRREGWMLNHLLARWWCAGSRRKWCAEGSWPVFCL